jgi:hypothetical protein
MLLQLWSKIGMSRLPQWHRGSSHSGQLLHAPAVTAASMMLALLRSLLLLMALP